MILFNLILRPVWVCPGWLLGLVCLAGLARAGDQPDCDTTTPSARKTHVPRMSYIANQYLRLGIDLNLGGAITYLAPATNLDLNVINSSDWGRQVQLSYYSGPVPYHPPGSSMNPAWQFIGWNPIQAGDCYGHEARVLQHTNTGTRLYTRLIPMHWPLKNVPGECECEVWLELAGPVVQARCRLTNQRRDHTQYPARTQELPAVYVNGPYCHLITYRGEQPYTGDGLTELTNRLDLEKHWTQWTATEHWAAQVNAAGWGLGVWNPDTLVFSGGFFSQPGAGGPHDSPTGYLAPNRSEILDYNIVYDYQYELILGTVAEIRAEAARRAVHPRELAFHFEQDRQGWTYVDATDAGWPIRGELQVHLNGQHPRVVSPEFFMLAAMAPSLVLQAAFPAGCTEAAVTWRRLEEKAKEFPGTNTQTFAVIPDGQVHRYAINLGAAPAYAGIIRQLSLAVPGARPAARLRLQSVTLGPAGGPGGGQ